jgi:hypothetical protein
MTAGKSRRVSYLPSPLIKPIRRFFCGSGGVALAAAKQGISLNKYISEILERETQAEA